MIALNLSAEPQKLTDELTGAEVLLSTSLVRAGALSVPMLEANEGLVLRPMQGGA